MEIPRPQNRTIESPNDWLEEAFCSILLEAGGNVLEDFQATPIFERPIMGVTEAGDDIFGVFRSVVSSRHIRPADLLRSRDPRWSARNTVKVVSWALPFSREIPASNRGREWPSALYSVARNNGAALIHQTLGRIVRILRERGYASIAPALTQEYDAFRSWEFTYSSTWSERHVAYAAGLGRFGLNGCLITARGTNVRLASIVTTLPLDVTVKKRPDHRASCLENGGEGCGLCVERCPVGAISRQGFDKARCYGRRQAIREKFLEPYSQKFGLHPSPIVKGGRRESGFSLGCALCMSDVPCASASFDEGKDST